MNNAIELDPEDAQNYSFRGAMFGIIGNQVLAMENIKVAAQLGNEKAQEILQRKGVEGCDKLLFCFMLSTLCTSASVPFGA